MCIHKRSWRQNILSRIPTNNFYNSAGRPILCNSISGSEFQKLVPKIARKDWNEVGPGALQRDLNEQMEVDHQAQPATHGFPGTPVGDLIPMGYRVLRDGSVSPTPSSKNLLVPLFLMGHFPVDFQEVKRPLSTRSGKHPIKAGKRPINEGKRPIKAKVLVGVSVASLVGCFVGSGQKGSVRRGSVKN